MPRVAAAFAAFLVVACASGAHDAPRVVPFIAYPFTSADLARPDVRACLAKLLPWSAAASGERGAFLRMRDDGRFLCVWWAPAMLQREARWQGSAPEGTAAILHTHPPSQPLPSGHDADVARQTGVPVFVVTPDGVSVAPAGGGAVVKLAGRDYWRE